MSEIIMIPTKTSQLINDSGYITETDIQPIQNEINEIKEDVTEIELNVKSIENVLKTL